MLDYIKNQTVFANKYKTNSEAMIVACFFNPQNSPYRIKAFNHFYESIKHLNHRIIECVIGDSKPHLEENENIKRVFTDNLLWHKETLLNTLIADLPEEYKYIFWIDADVIFTNLNWLVDGVEQLQENTIIQPFEHCVHLEKDEVKPSYPMEALRAAELPNNENDKVWRGFGATYATTELWDHELYNNHGHVGFAWAARREILEAVPLYDKALIGGADHIIAHAAAGQFTHPCILKCFIDNIEEITEWSEEFYQVAKGKIGYVKGDLYHIWHGDIDKREYLTRIQDFTAKTKKITHRDKNGLFVTDNENDTYMQDYFKRREVPENSDSLPSENTSDASLLASVAGAGLVGGIVADTLNDTPSSTTDSLHTNTDFQPFS